MGTPTMSDVTTHGIRVGAAAFYLDEQSEPEDRRFLFGYNIVIVNESDTPVQLVSRHWIIIDSAGRRDEVRGAGVVGQTPRLEPGEAFKYQSFCPLQTSWGTMEGKYFFRRDSGEEFDVEIARFYLVKKEAERKG